MPSTKFTEYLSFAWSGEFDSLKDFVKEILMLDGQWTQPGGDKKLFTVYLRYYNHNMAKEQEFLLVDQLMVKNQAISKRKSVSASPLQPQSKIFDVYHHANDIY